MSVEAGTLKDWQQASHDLREPRRRMKHALKYHLISYKSNRFNFAADTN